MYTFSPTPTNINSSYNSNALSSGAIGGIVAGSVIGLAIIITALYCMFVRNRNRRTHNERNFEERLEKVENALLARNEKLYD